MYTQEAEKGEERDLQTGIQYGKREGSTNRKLIKEKRRIYTQEAEWGEKRDLQKESSKIKERDLQTGNQ